MEIVKTGEKIWQITVIHQICQSFLPPMFFTIYNTWISQSTRGKDRGYSRMPTYIDFSQV